MLHFEATLLLPPPKLRAGERSVETQFAIHIRDEMFRETARKFFSDLPSCRKQAQALQKALSDYAASAWLRERTLDQCPARHAGKINSNCWRIFKVHDRVPSFSTINEALRKK